MENKKIVFVDGLRVKKIADNYYDLGRNVNQFINFLKANEDNGWVHINICKSKEKESYFGKLNDWKPTKKQDDELIGEEEIPY